MTRRRRQEGFTLLELVIVLACAAIILGVAFTRWQAYVALERVRHGTIQVATDLRQAAERAKAERIAYTVTFTTGSSVYTIARNGGGFLENASLPPGVDVTASQVLTFTAFGRPGAPYSVTLQNGSGNGTASVTAVGGISYQIP